MSARTRIVKSRRRDPTVILLGIAHALTLVAGLFMAIGPFYQGVSATPGLVGNSSSYESVRMTASLIAVNGLRVIPLLLSPAVITAASLLLAFRGNARKGLGRLVLWVAALLLLLFCLAGIFSIGIFYLPSAALMIAAAVVARRRAL